MGVMRGVRRMKRQWSRMRGQPQEHANEVSVKTLRPDVGVSLEVQSWRYPG